jgi:dimethylamine monooxygenase subunit A
VAPIHLPEPRDPHRHSVGARRFDPAEWFDFGPGAEAQLREKRRVLAAHHDEVVAALPGSEDACAELLTMVEDHLSLPHVAGDAHPIERAGLLVPEDLCVHLPGDDGRPVLVAASLSFPFRWVLAEKLGLPMSEIHAPIPGYAEQIGAAVDKVFARLTPERGLLRSNIGVVDAPDLFQPRRPDIGPQPVPDGFHLRSERQTLRVLPRTGAIVFTIRTTVLPFVDLDVDQRRRTAGHIRALDDALLDYRGLTYARDDLLVWLESPP